jgi:integrase/recombinase XerD
VSPRPSNIPTEVELWAESLQVARGLSPHTVSAYQSDVEHFFASGAPLQARRANVETWLKNLAKKHENPRSTARRLSALRQFYQFAVSREWVAENPTTLVPLPLKPQTLPKALSSHQIQLLLEAPLGDSPTEVRLRLILQLLYATGLRVSELTNLTRADVTQGEGVTLRVTGKGGKTRIVPLGEVAAATLETYLTHARPRLKGAQGPWVLMGPSGKRPLTRVRVFQLVKEAGARVGVAVAPHHLRHTFATHLLANAADLHAVQLMLGHSSLNTTQIYTQVATQKMKDTVNTLHPLATGIFAKKPKMR